MVLKQIDLLNFRLHKNTSIKFSDKLNLIVGGNGQGKTSILEAIYYLCTTKNLNLASEYDVLSFGSDYFEVKGTLQDISTNKVRFFYDPQKNKKNYFLDDKQIFSAANIIGKFPIVTLIQSDHSITLGSPSERRKFVDSVISQSSATYLKILIDYNKILKQRSVILNQIKETRDRNLYDQLEAWTESLIKSGTELIIHKTEFVKEFNTYMFDAYNNIVEGLEQPVIFYNTLTGNSNDKTEEVFRSKLEEVKQDEIRRGVNLVGPHRDDFVFSINGLELKRFGSQGQHKTFQIALRFGQFFYLKEKVGKAPLFLMDDVFGELDEYRAGRISGYITKIGQSFITMTDLTKTENLRISGESILIKVNNGKAATA